MVGADGAQGAVEAEGAEGAVEAQDAVEAEGAEGHAEDTERKAFSEKAEACPSSPATCAAHSAFVRGIEISIFLIAFDFSFIKKSTWSL
jgi:hypothetical protein